MTVTMTPNQEFYCVTKNLNVSSGLFLGMKFNDGFDGGSRFIFTTSPSDETSQTFWVDDFDNFIIDENNNFFILS